MPPKPKKSIGPKPVNVQVNIDDEDSKCPSCDQPKCELECEICMRWFHTECVGVSALKFKQISDHNFHWYCDECDVAAVKIHGKMKALITENTNLKVIITNLQNKFDLFETQFKTFVEDRQQEISTKIINGRANLKEEMKLEIRDEIRAEVVQATQEVEDINNPNPWQQVMRSQRNQPVPNFQEIIQEQMNEQKQIEAIKKNLTMSGIAESDKANDDSAAEEDLQRAKAIILQELDIEADIEKVVRCGRKKSEDPEKPRLIKLFMKSQDNRKRILQNAKQLRNSEDQQIKLRVYIGPDQTKKQQLESKNLRDELRTKRLENPDRTFKIQRGQIIED